MANVGYATLSIIPSMRGFQGALQGQVMPAMGPTGKKGGAALGGAMGVSAGKATTASFVPMLKRVIGPLAAVFAVKKIKDFFGASITGASDLQESVNAVEVVFGSASGEILALSDNAAKSVGLSKTEFNALATEFSNFAMTVDDGSGDVSGRIDEMTTRTADFASVMNLDVNEAAGLFNSALAGQSQPLRRYGIDLSAAAVENHALAEGIWSGEGAMTESEKVMARWSLLMQETENVAGDFSNTSDSLANRQRVLAATWEDSKAAIGAAFLPVMESLVGVFQSTVEVMTPVIEAVGVGLAGAMETASDWIGRFVEGLTDGSNKIDPITGQVLYAAEGAESLGEKIRELVKDILDWVDSARDWLAENQGMVDALKTAAPLVLGLVAAWKLLKRATPLGMLMALATGLIYAYENSDTFRGIVDSLVEAFQRFENPIAVVAGLIGGIFVTKMIVAGVQSAIATGKIVAGFVAQGIAATKNLIFAVRYYVTLAAQAVIGAASHVRSVARIVGGWILMGVQSLIAAGKVALAWLIAMGPIALIVAAVIGLVIIVVKNWDKIKAAVTKGAKAAWDIAVRTFNRMREGISAALARARERVTTAFNAIRTGVTNAVNRIRTAVTQRFNAIRTAITNAVNNIRTAVVERFNAVRTRVVNIVTQLRARITSTFNSIRTAITNVVNNIRNAITERFTAIRTRVVNIVNTIRTRITTAFNNIRTAVVDRVNAIRQNVVDRFNAIRERISSVVTTIRTRITTGFNNIKNAVRDRLNDVITYVRNIPGRITRALSNIGTLLLSTGRDLISGFLRGIRNRASDLASTIKNHVTDKLPGFIKGPLGIKSPSRVFMKLGEAVTDGFNIGIASKQRETERAMKSLVSVPDAPNIEGPGMGLNAPTGLGLNQRPLQGSFSDTTLEDVVMELRELRDEVHRQPGKIAQLNRTGVR